MIEKDDLYSIYFWNDRSRYWFSRKTNPDNSDLTPTDGYQMLFMLNWFLKITDKDTCLQIERFIRKESLGDNLTEKEMLRWVDKAFFT